MAKGAVPLRDGVTRALSPVSAGEETPLRQESGEGTYLQSFGVWCLHKHCPRFSA